MLERAGSVLSDKVVDTLKKATEYCVFKITCELTNPTTSYKVTPRRVLAFGIQQDFVQSYTDQTSITIELMPKEIQEMLQNTQDLECIVKLTPMDSMSFTEVYDQEEIIYEKKVILPENQDLEKKFNAGAYVNTETGEYDTLKQQDTWIPIELQLMDKDIYEIRHVQINAMFNDVTHEALLHWIGQQFNVDEVKCVAPDNTRTFKNLVIPPTKDISTVFPYLQERYGIYAKGMGYYVMKGILYNYPLWDVNQSTSPEDSVLHIYKGPEKYFLGLDKYHARIDKDIHIVTIAPVDLSALNTAGSENTGNVHVSTNAEAIYDQFAPINKDGSITRDGSDITTVTLQNEAGNMTSNMQNVKYTGERTNIYQSTSEMAANDGTMIKIGWKCAYPHAITPGQHVIYYYTGENNELKTASGRIMGVSYLGQVQPSDALQPWFNFTSTIVAKLEADQQSEAEIQQS